jgi:dTDP-4-amino-4,6-dideoxygalactose transaminase
MVLGFSSTSRTTSAGPKDVAAKGDVTGGREVSEFDLRLSDVLGVGGVLMTSALTTPTT